MAAISRLRAAWGGAALVGPGVSTFYFSAASVGKRAVVASFFDALKANFPLSVGITVPSTGEVIESTTGALIGSWSEAGAPTVVNGTSAGDFAQGVGARMRWITAGVVGNRLVKGSTFLCPLSAVSYDPTGTILAGFVGAAEVAAGTLITDPNTENLIWSRPIPGRAGVASTVLSAQMPDRISWLRSRRT